MEDGYIECTIHKKNNFIIRESANLSESTTFIYFFISLKKGMFSFIKKNMKIRGWLDGENL